MGSPLMVVVGALTMELVVRVDQAAESALFGHTVRGSDPESSAGGGGIHLAVAAARLGASVHLLGRVGADDAGSRLLSALDAHRVATGFVTITDDVPTGTSIELLGGSALRSGTVLCPGANARLTPPDIDRALPLIRTAGALILQLGIPVETAVHVVRVAHRAKVPVILNPIPFEASVTDTLPRELLDVAMLSVGEKTARRILGLPLLGPTPSAPAATPPTGIRADHRQIASDLLARGCKSVILKLGELGSLHASAGAAPPSAPSELFVPAFRIKVKDTSAAGYAFDAALAVAATENKPPADMLRFANAAAGLACTHAGTQSSLPHRADVDDLVRRWG